MTTSQPDFEKMAHDIVMSVPAVMNTTFILHREHIAQQLRFVWNARGKADRAVIDNAADTDPLALWAPPIRRAIQSLDC